MSLSYQIDWNGFLLLQCGESCCQSLPSNHMKEAGDGLDLMSFTAHVKTRNLPKWQHTNSFACKKKKFHPFSARIQRCTSSHHLQNFTDDFTFLTRNLIFTPKRNVIKRTKFISSRIFIFFRWIPWMTPLGKR